MALERDSRPSADQRPVTVLAFDHGNLLRDQNVFVQQAAHLKSRSKAIANISVGVSKLLLYKLILGEGVALELLAIQSIFSSPSQTVLKSSYGSLRYISSWGPYKQCDERLVYPCDTVTSLIQAPERSFESGDLREHVLLWYFHVVHQYHSGSRGPQAVLVGNFRSRKCPGWGARPLN